MLDIVSSQNNFVKKITAIGVHGRFNISVTLQPGINILYGKNGTGKTTLMHILANALNGDFVRFVFLQFKQINIHLDYDEISIVRNFMADKEEIVVKINDNVNLKIPVDKTRELLLHYKFRKRFPSFEEDNEETFELMRNYLSDIGMEQRKSLLKTAYFPAFRTMIDAWASAREESEFRYRGPVEWTDRATLSARTWFGDFVPAVNYPSLLEIEYKLSEEINRARLTIGRADRELLSKAFLQIFMSLSESPEIESEAKTPDAILAEIKQLFGKLQESFLQEEATLGTRIYRKLQDYIKELTLRKEKVERTTIRVLEVYLETLKKIINIQEEAFAGIQRYLKSVNEFLEGKKLFVDPKIPRYRGSIVGIQFNDGETVNGLRSLSSGERQIVTLIYATTHMNDQKIALIDEPEISLHVDWQRRLLRSMSKQIGSSQIIACTHSPIIAADYPDRQQELSLS